MIYTSSIFGPVEETLYLHLKRICAKAELKVVGSRMGGLGVGQGVVC